MKTYIENVFMSILVLIKEVFDFISPNYILRVLVAKDCVGNAASGGSYKVTVSARTGYQANKKNPSRFWLVLEALIDWAFYPIDGLNHCVNSIKEGDRFKQDSDIRLFAVACLIFLFAPLIGVAIRFFLKMHELYLWVKNK